MNERTHRVNYDYMATKLLADHSPRAHGRKIEGVAQHAIHQGLLDARKSATNKNFEITEKTRILRKIGLRTWLRRQKIRNEWYSFLTLEEAWHATQEQKTTLRRWGMSMLFPQQHGAGIGRLIKYRDALVEPICQHILQEGNILSIGIPRVRPWKKQYPQLAYPGPAIILEPITSFSIAKMLRTQSARKRTLSVSRLEQPGFEGLLDVLSSGPCWVCMNRPAKTVAVASLAQDHDLFDDLRRFYV